MNAPVRSLSGMACASQTSLHVIVIGGGIGGLCLAQGLKKVDVSVAVYERDRTPTDRLQGYRVHISPAGSRALAACLPAALFETFERTCGKPARAVHMLTEHMGRLITLGGDRYADLFAGDGVAKHRSVSRITLRQVLLSGLDDVVHFGKAFTHYEKRADGRIVAHFEDGSTAEGDVLVAADGGGSRVRRQFLPDAERIDTGVVAIAGKIFLDDESRRRIAPEFLDGLAIVAARHGFGMFVAIQELGDGRAQDGIGGNDVAMADAGNHFDNTRSYLMWALSAQREKLGLTAGLDGAAEPPDAEVLRAIALRAMARWDPAFRDLVRLADRATISTIAIRTSAPVAPWQSERVTLIGDAIHAMTPYRGIGANVALKDAVRLRDALVRADLGEAPLNEAIGGYETEMRRYGFAAVRNSLKAMQQVTAQGPIGLALSRAMFRLVDRLPPVKRLMFRRMGDE